LKEVCNGLKYGRQCTGCSGKLLLRPSKSTLFLILIFRPFLEAFRSSYFLKNGAAVFSDTRPFFVDLISLCIYTCIVFYLSDDCLIPGPPPLLSLFQEKSSYRAILFVMFKICAFISSTKRQITPGLKSFECSHLVTSQLQSAPV